jgi:nucleolar protein 56
MKHMRTWFGIFNVNEDRIISGEVYPRDVKTLADRLYEVPTALEISTICGHDIRTFAKEWGFVGSDEEYDALFYEVNIEYARRQVNAALSDEHILIQITEALDDLDIIANALTERLKELYDLNFPELKLKGEPLVNFISRYGTRQAPDIWGVLDETILCNAEKSRGIGLPESIADTIQDMAANIAGLFDDRNRLSQYIEIYVNRTYPNLSEIAGAHIGARLIKIAGSSKKLAGMPSGTVQVLGAEKALFKHLKGSAPSPKHGVIFQHPLIKNSPWWIRGKIARILASHISIAVRIDYYSGDYRREIVENLNKKVEALRKQFPNPPKGKAK